MLATHVDSLAVGRFRFHRRLHAGERGIQLHLHLFRRELAQLRILIARRLELRQRERLVLQDHRDDVVGREQRLELALVAGKIPCMS